VPTSTNSTTEPSICTLIADRNRMSSQLLAESLAQHSRFSVVVATTTAEILSLSAARKPNVVVISADLESVARKGLHIARTLSARHPNINIVILLEVDQREEVIASFRNGARGVFCRSESLAEFTNCVVAVSRGQIWVNNVEAEYLLDAVKSTPSFDAMSDVHTLSKREVEVAELAAQGLTNKQIADQLDLSEHTVKNYLFRVFEKLKISNRIELLFRLLNERKDNLERQTIRLPAVVAGESVQTYLKAAQDGSIRAPFMLALAYLEGSGVEKNQESAYFWLRITEKHCSEILQRGRALLEDLKRQMRPDEIAALDKTMFTTLRNNTESALGKRPTELVQANVTLLSRLVG
jgi:two-component system, NarL family, nitrate/nitrite response regulator NarL